MKNMETLSFAKSYRSRKSVHGNERLEAIPFTARHNSIQTPASTTSKRTGIVEAYGTGPTSPPQIGQNF